MERIADVSRIVCPMTRVTVRQAAAQAAVAHTDLGGEITAHAPDVADPTLAMITDARVLTGLFAAEMGRPPAGRPDLADAAERAHTVHRATILSDRFALYVALVLPAVLRGQDGRAEP